METEFTRWENMRVNSVNLSGTYCYLTTLRPEDIPEIITLAGDTRIWEFFAENGGNPDNMLQIQQKALQNLEKGTQVPFTIRLHKTGKIIGASRFMDVHPEHRKLEIGWTWYHPDFWGTGMNFDCKLQMLSYAFETLQTLRVQLKTDERNKRSQNAIVKIGATYEGTFRNDIIRENGTSRNSVYYSIIDSEWPRVKAGLEAHMATFGK